MDYLIPNLEWYTSISKDKEVQPRCPFATTDQCPRFYQSLSLLGDVGVSTPIQPDEDKRLKSYWEKADIWPKTDEQTTTVYGKPYIFSKFCPEVSFEHFGYFASSLSQYADDMDSGYAAERLSREGAPSGYWGYSWAGITELHYTDCPIYSILMYRGDKGVAGTESNKKQSKYTEFYHNHPLLFWLIATVISAIIGVIGIIVAL